jgi:deoxycytidine triphosphate deaminase
MLKSKSWLAAQVLEQNMLDPFCAECVHENVVPFGLGESFYTLRLSREWRLVKREKRNKIFDPHLADNGIFNRVYVSYIDIYPRSFILGKTLEKVALGPDVVGLLVGCSTYQQLGLHITVPILPPGYNDYVLIGLSNLSPSTVRVYAEEGIANLHLMELGS